MGRKKKIDMSSRNEIDPEAFRYACILVLPQFYHSGKDFHIERNKSYVSSKALFEFLEAETQELHIKAASSAMGLVLESEPRIAAKGGNLLTAHVEFEDIYSGCNDITFQDNNGQKCFGVSCSTRRLPVIHRSIGIRSNWEPADIYEPITGYSCSNDYNEMISPVLQQLKEASGLTWESVYPGNIKSDKVYAPVLHAVIGESIRYFDTHPDAAANLVHAFLGMTDQYRLHVFPERRQVKVSAFNMNGNLNCSPDGVTHLGDIPTMTLPSKLIKAGFKEMSSGELLKNTIVLTFDAGWTFSMRLHNASTKISPTSLKFDIQMLGTPYDVYQKQMEW